MPKRRGLRYMREVGEKRVFRCAGEASKDDGRLSQYDVGKAAGEAKGELSRHGLFSVVRVTSRRER